MAKKEDNVKPIIDAARGLSNKQKRVQIRKNAQQALLYLHDVIANKNERYYTSDSNSGKLPALTADSYDDYTRAFATDQSSMSGPDEYGEYGNGLDLGWKSGYRNIIPIEKGKYADGVSPLTSLGENINKFFSFKLTSAQQAALYPKLRLYKILYELDGKGNIKLPAKEKSREEIIFEKAITSKELDILTARGGNIGSSGIESFEWKLMGVNPADTDSNIEASLKIYFNNVGVFAERIENLNAAADIEAAVPVGPRTLAQQNILDSTKKAHFLDLITFAPPTTKNTNSLPCNEVYDPSFFEILAEVGWEVPGGSLKLFNTDQITHIKDQTVKLYLTLTDHKFDFKEDGSATLVANYRARQNFSDPEFDLLYPRGDLATQIENLNNLRTDENTDQEAASDEQAKEEAELQKNISVLLKENYKRIISGLLDNLYEAEIPNALLLNSVLPVRTLDRRERGGMVYRRDGNETLSWNQLFELLQRQQSLNYRYINSRGGNNRRDVELQDAITDVQNQIEAASNIKVNRRPLGVVVITGLSTEKGGTIMRTLDTDDYLSDDRTPFDDSFGEDLQIGDSTDTLSKIQFFYLGDILEVMLETIGITTELSNIKVAFVTTDFEYINLFKIIKKIENNGGNLTIPEIQNFDFSKLKCAERTFKKSDFKNFYSVLNVANIPIEATAFLDFFTEKIVAQERQNYYLNNFLSDLFTQLVKPALGDNAIQGMTNNQPALINTDVSAVDNINSPLFRSPPFTPRNRINNPTRYNEYKLVFDSSVESQYTFIRSIEAYQVKMDESKVLFQNPPSNITNNVATVKIIGVNGGTNYLDGKYETNIKEGITNFVVGLDRGLIKSVSFERVDQPYLRESRTATDKSFGVGQLRELYNVNLTLYGNNLVKPGQMIYVEPNRFVFGRPTEINSVSRLLGLGGYHLVVDVSNTIGKEGWETSVRALHMAMPAIVK